jgi:hypothetical protein
MRTFRFESGDPDRAILNGRPYFMRGSNVTLYRFFEDARHAGDLPWNASSGCAGCHQADEARCTGTALRYCIGFPPEAWYRIADEEGLLIRGRVSRSGTGAIRLVEAVRRRSGVQSWSVEYYGMDAGAVEPPVRR